MVSGDIHTVVAKTKWLGRWKMPWELFSWPKRNVLAWETSLEIVRSGFYLLVWPGPGPEPWRLSETVGPHARNELTAPKFVLGGLWSPPWLVASFY